MDAAWPVSDGEAIHTSTFLGHPVGCAMALAEMEEIEQGKLVEKSAATGDYLLGLLKELAQAGVSRLELEARGLGLLAGIELRAGRGRLATRMVLETIKRMLHRGYILLPEGDQAQVISFSPPLTISRAQLAETVRVLGGTLREAARSVK